MRSLSPAPKFSFRIGKRAALAILMALGGALAGTILLDIYQDWIPEGKPLWTTLAENGIFLALALLLPVGAWRLTQLGKQGQLSETAKGALLGSGAAALLAGLALGLQVVQGEIKPLVLTIQVTVAGALGGFLYGYSRPGSHPHKDFDQDSSQARGREAATLQSPGPEAPKGSPWGPLAVLAAVGIGLTGAILFDIYQDWFVEGNRLWSTLLENLLPLALAFTVPLFGGWLAWTGRRHLHLRQVTAWALLGTVGTLTLSAVVLGLQVYQGEWKPGIMVTQLTAAGAVAGLLIGHKNARVEQASQALQRRESRLRALANSIPGGVFQFEVRDDGTQETTFLSPTARRLLKITDGDLDVYDQFLEGVPDSHRDEVQSSLEAAIGREEPLDLEVPFEETSGERRWLQVRSTPKRESGRLVFHGIISDITDRKEAERRRKTYEELKENAEDAIVIANAAGEIIDWNPGAASIFGYEREEILGRRIEAIMPDRHREPHRRGMERVRETGHADLIGETVEMEGLHKEGHEVPVELSLFNWHGEEKQFFAAIIRDITQRKEAQRARREERARFETLFENLPSPAVRCVATGEGAVIADANRAFETTFGVAAAQAEGADVDELLVPEASRNEARKLNRRVLEEGEAREEVRREAADGPRDFQLRAARRDPEDGPPEVYALYTDITDRKKRERRLEAIFNHTFQFTGLMEPDGTMVEANDTALRFGGLDREDVVGTPIWETHWAQTGEASKKKLREAVGRAAEGEFVRYEREIQGAEETRIIDLSIRPITDETGEVTMLIPEARDITELKKREQKLREAKEEAEESSRLKTAMLANMSHEIRTPLTPINGFAESLADQLEGHEAKLARRIRKSGKRLQETIDSVLELSQLEAGTQTLNQKPVDLRDAAEAGLDVLQSWADEKGVDLHPELPEAPAETLGDEAALRRIAENLLENAIKFTPEGGAVTVRVGREEKEAFLEVEDSGIGISKGAQSEIFNAFRQESEGMDREFEGTGLGLAIVKRLAHALGGTVEVESEKGEGSRFTVRLPRRRKPSPDEGSVASQVPPGEMGEAWPIDDTEGRS